MARTFVQPGGTLTLTAPADVKSGGVVQKGALIGIAETDAAQGQEVETKLWGVHELPKGSGAIQQGDLCFWDGSKVVAAAGENGAPLLGVCMLDAGADAPSIRVRLNGISV